MLTSLLWIGLALAGLFLLIPAALFLYVGVVKRARGTVLIGVFFLMTAVACWICWCCMY
jgi:threonine/homoserine efflux transporter RhtA